MTLFPGASPADVEELITDKLEKQLENLDDVKEMRSSSGEGYSSVFLEFEAGADVKESIRKLRDEVESVKAELPEDAEDPIVTEVQQSDMPIILIGLAGNYEKHNNRSSSISTKGWR